MEMATEVQLVCFDIAGSRLAVWGRDVVEVLRMVALQPLGEKNDALLGAINRRGQVVTVFDLRRALRLPPSRPKVTDLLVILDTPEGHCAIAVDAVTDIAAVGLDQTKPRDRLPGLGKHVAEVVTLRDQMMSVLDVQWLLRQGDGIVAP
jgi:chemotaxis signal transduction protein